MMQPMMFGFETEYKLTKFMEDIPEDNFDDFVSRNSAMDLPKSRS